MSQRDVVYDDTYSGPRFVYGLTYRPAGFAQVPDGRIILGDRKDSRFNHGTVQYPRKLSEAEVDTFQLTYLGKVNKRTAPDALPAAVLSRAHVARAAKPKSARAARVVGRPREWVQVVGRVQKLGHEWHVRYDGNDGDLKEHATVWTDGYNEVNWSARKGHGSAEVYAEGSVAFEDTTDAMKAAIREARRIVTEWLDACSGGGGARTRRRR